MKKYIANNIVVDLDDSEIIDDNGLVGDAKRALWVERATAICWIETNGDPEVYETIEEARAMLGNGRADE